jgi:hypothetical protein
MATPEQNERSRAVSFALLKAKGGSLRARLPFLSRRARDPSRFIGTGSSHAIPPLALAAALTLALVLPTATRAQQTILSFFGADYAFPIPAGYQLRKRYDTATSEIAIFDSADDAVRLTLTATKILTTRPDRNTCRIDGKQFETVPYAASTDVDVTVCRLRSGEFAARLVRFEACGPSCTLYALIADRHAAPDLSLVGALEQSIARMRR